MNGPFADTAFEYLALGWHPLPLPRARKTPPPSGYTGQHGATAGGADVQSWIEDGYRSETKAGAVIHNRPAGLNIAIRYPRNVIALDVDNPEAFEQMIAAVGVLPATWRIRSGGATSGDHHLYRLPAGVDSDMFNGSLIVPGTGEIAGEMLRWKHRYSVAPPSTHPTTGRRYAWINPAGDVTTTAPAPTDLTELPAAWIRHLTPRPRGNLSPAGGWPVTDPAAYVAACVKAILDQPAGGRHDHLKAVCTRLALKGILAEHAEHVAAAAEQNGKARGEVESIIAWCLANIPAGQS